MSSQLADSAHELRQYDSLSKTDTGQHILSMQNIPVESLYNLKVTLDSPALSWCLKALRCVWKWLNCPVFPRPIKIQLSLQHFTAAGVEKRASLMGSYWGLPFGLFSNKRRPVPESGRSSSLSTLLCNRDFRVKGQCSFVI